MNPLTAKHWVFIINVGKSAAGFIFKKLNNIINAAHQQKTNRMTTKQKLLLQKHKIEKETDENDEVEPKNETFEEDA